MNILFLAANPVDTNRLRLDEEIRTIDQRLRAAESRKKFNLVQGWAVRPGDLSGYLLRYQPHVVHFSGHGSEAVQETTGDSLPARQPYYFDVRKYVPRFGTPEEIKSAELFDKLVDKLIEDEARERLRASSLQGGIILEDDSGNRKPVSPQALGRLFRALKDNTRCVVLNACFSAIQAQAIVEEVGCVVGMSRAIGDKAAIKFAGGFYEALGYDRSVQTAFDVGCSQIDLEGLGKEDTPRLLVREGVDASRLILTNASTTGATAPAPPSSQSSNPAAKAQDIQAALLSAFPDKSNLKQMALFGLGINLDTIAGGSNLAAITFNLIEWAVANDRLLDLVRAARKANSGNAKLKAVATDLEIG
ncbi:MAG TPA: effector-associated domain EAD1-containing protein [Chloroflexia bacterium]|nr:effector-associated domain EAD1-containing protein [Chloroflexia bacterium]